MVRFPWQLRGLPFLLAVSAPRETVSGGACSWPHSAFVPRPRDCGPSAHLPPPQPVAALGATRGPGPERAGNAPEGERAVLRLPHAGVSQPLPLPNRPCSPGFGDAVGKGWEVVAKLSPPPHPSGLRLWGGGFEVKLQKQPTRPGRRGWVLCPTRSQSSVLSPFRADHSGPFVNTSSPCGGDSLPVAVTPAST